MNKYIKYAFAAASLVFASTSCSDFGDTNIDPEHMNEGNVPGVMLVFTQHSGCSTYHQSETGGTIVCMHIAKVILLLIGEYTVATVAHFVM